VRRTETPEPIWIKFFMVVDITGLVTHTNFGDHRLRGFWVAGGQISPSPIDFHRRQCVTMQHTSCMVLRLSKITDMKSTHTVAAVIESTVQLGQLVSHTTHTTV